MSEKSCSAAGETGSLASSGYFSSQTGQDISEPALEESEALEILALSRERGCPLQKCRNSRRGCPVNSYPRIVSMHEEFCKFPEVRKMAVRGKLNFRQADKKCFKIFCESFDKMDNVIFLFKMTLDGDSVKICAQQVGKVDRHFTLTLYDKKSRHIYKITDKTGLRIHLIPAKVFKEVGALVRYKIKLT